MHDEGYIIVPDGQGGLAVIADTSAGIFYGAQTVKQLIRGQGKDACSSCPLSAIGRRWRIGALRRLVARTPAEHGLPQARNPHLGGIQGQHLSPYFEHTFAYDSSPVAAFPGER